MRTEHSQEAARIHPHSALKIATVRFVKRKAPKVLVSAAGTRGFTAERQGVAEPLAVANAGPSIRRQYSTKTAVYPKKMLPCRKREDSMTGRCGTSLR